jgi:hypothetical protein
LMASDGIHVTDVTDDSMRMPLSFRSGLTR